MKTEKFMYIMLSVFIVVLSICIFLNPTDKYDRIDPQQIECKFTETTLLPSGGVLVPITHYYVHCKDGSRHEVEWSFYNKLDIINCK